MAAPAAPGKLPEVGRCSPPEADLCKMPLPGYHRPPGAGLRKLPEAELCKLLEAGQGVLDAMLLVQVLDLQRGVEVLAH